MPMISLFTPACSGKCEVKYGKLLFGVLYHVNENFSPTPLQFVFDATQEEAEGQLTKPTRQFGYFIVILF